MTRNLRQTKRLFCWSVLLLVLTIVPTQSDATMMSFFGYDLIDSSSPDSTPNSDAARDLFLSYLDDYGTEDFEGFDSDYSFLYSPPQPLVFESTTTGAVSYIDGGLTSNFSYPAILGENSLYSSTVELSFLGLSFADQVSAFGYYGKNPVSGLQLTIDSTTTYLLPIDEYISTYYFGIIDLDDTFGGVQWKTTLPGGGMTFFDNMTVATSLKTAPVPEPSTILLLGSGLVGLGWYRRKRKKA